MKVNNSIVFIVYKGTDELAANRVFDKLSDAEQWIRDSFFSSKFIEYRVINLKKVSSVRKEKK